MANRKTSTKELIAQAQKLSTPQLIRMATDPTLRAEFELQADPRGKGIQGGVGALLGGVVEGFTGGLAGPPEESEELRQLQFQRFPVSATGGKILGSVMGVGKFGAGLGIKGAGFLARKLPKVMKGATELLGAGAGAGGLEAGVRETAAGGDVGDILSATGAGGATGAATSGAFGIAGKGLRKFGEKGILEPQLKVPFKETQKVTSRFRAEDVVDLQLNPTFLKRVFGGGSGLKQINTNANKRLDQLLKEQQAIIDTKSDAPVNLFDLLDLAEDKLETRIASGEFSGSADKVRKAFNEFADDWFKRMSATGTVSLNTAQKLKTSTQKIPAFTRDEGTANKDAAVILGSVLRDKIEEVVPKIAGPNQLFSQIKPIQRFTEAAISTQSRRDLAQLAREAFFTLTVGGGGGAAAGQMAAGLGLGAVFLAGIRGLKSPTVGAGLSRFGKRVAEPGGFVQRAATAGQVQSETGAGPLLQDIQQQIEQRRQSQSQ